MKVYIVDGKIHNFHDDNYIGNKDLIFSKVKGFGFPRAEKDDVELNKTRTDFDFFQFVLDDKGIVQKLEKGNAEYDEAYVKSQKKKRAAEYPKEADPLFFKYQRGEATEQEWKDAVEAVKSRFPY